ncbi:MAG: O-antigen ligase family protein [Saprospiraceae bacterium]|nr:O-antigen ligase family protein [Saprospiraceae bacterium]
MVRWLFPILLFSIPLSISRDFGVHQINLPSEPLIVIASILLFLLIDFRELAHSSFIRHPISIFAIMYLGWMTFTVPFSSDFMVSTKYLIVTLAYWWVFYIGFWYCKKTEDIQVEKWLRPYLIMLLGVIFYSWYHHAQYGFRVDVSVMTARPFYSDHALFSAAMSFFLFPVMSKIWVVKKPGLKVICMGISLILLLGIYWSYSRAAWLSVFGASFFGGLIYLFRMRFWHLALASLMLVSAGVYTVTKWAPSFEITAVSKQGGWQNQLKSIVNVTTDVSNLERLNRYRCAWRMFLDRPIMGFGPGTFAEAYLPYQKPEEMTRLSVTSARAPDGSLHPSGHGGGAHSEYFKALSELGLMGLLIWLGLLGVSVHAGMQVYFESSKRNESPLALGMTLAIICYGILGLFNDFCHSEKISMLFWTFLAGAWLKNHSDL